MQAHIDKGSSRGVTLINIEEITTLCNVPTYNSFINKLINYTIQTTQTTQTLASNWVAVFEPLEHGNARLEMCASTTIPHLSDDPPVYVDGFVA